MFALQAWIGQRRDIFKRAARFRDQRIGRSHVGVGALHEIVALRIAHHDVAAMRPEGHPEEARRLRKKA